jgi:hypothetical protein
MVTGRPLGTEGEIEIRKMGAQGHPWSRRYACSDGAVIARWRRAEPMTQIANLFALFASIVAVDGLDPTVGLLAFRCIDEFREWMPLDLAPHDLATALAEADGWRAWLENPEATKMLPA